MFDEMFEEMQERFFDSMQEDFGGILRSSRMEISREVERAVRELMGRLFGGNNPANGTFKKPPQNIGDDYNSRDSYSGHGGAPINVIPGTLTTNISDTLVAYCIGGDLSSILERMINEVTKHRFKNVIFFTTKWDAAAVSGNNFHRLQSLHEFRQNGSDFCFILAASILRLSGIHLI